MNTRTWTACKVLAAITIVLGPLVALLNLFYLVIPSGSFFAVPFDMFLPGGIGLMGLVVFYLDRQMKAPGQLAEGGRAIPWMLSPGVWLVSLVVSLFCLVVMYVLPLVFMILRG
jgi:hypothetical protein